MCFPKIDDLGIGLGHWKIQISMYVCVYTTVYTLTLFFQKLRVSHIIFIIFLTQVIQVPTFHAIISYKI